MVLLKSTSHITKQSPHIAVDRKKKKSYGSCKARREKRKLTLVHLQGVKPEKQSKKWESFLKPYLHP